MLSFNYRLMIVVIAALLIAAVSFAQNKAGRGFDVSRMDRSVDACTDFYQFTNGNWLKSTEIPSAFSSWGSFYILAENNRKTLHEILEEAAKRTDAPKGSVDQKIGDFYATCIDETKREAEGIKPLLPGLERINNIKTVADVQAE